MGLKGFYCCWHNNAFRAIVQVLRLTKGLLPGQEGAYLVHCVPERTGVPGNIREGQSRAGGGIRLVTQVSFLDFRNQDGKGTALYSAITAWS